jgi:hypothetical protein
LVFFEKCPRSSELDLEEGYTLYQVRTLTPSAWYTIVLLALLTSPTQAQQGGQGQTAGHQYTRADFNQNRAIRAARPPDPVPNKKLDRIIDLPEIPSYSGKTEFISGEELDGAQSTSYRLRFYAKEEPTEVGKWYVDALSMYSWKLLDHGPTTCTARSKSGSQATVTVNQTLHKGMSSVVTIMYYRPSS